MIRLIFLAILASLAIPAAAQQQQCGLTQAVMVQLAMQYGETIVDERDRRDESDPDVVVTWRVWVNASTMTWTLTGTVDDVTCLFAAGRDYAGQTLDDFLKPDPEA